MGIGTPFEMTFLCNRNPFLHMLCRNLYTGVLFLNFGGALTEECLSHSLPRKYVCVFYGTLKAEYIFPTIHEMFYLAKIKTRC